MRRTALTVALAVLASSCSVPVLDPRAGTEPYPWHTRIVATTFWVGEVFDPTAEDGSQVLSAYDDDWLAHYGGCDGVRVGNDCETEQRTAATEYFPTRMSPKENPFYLDLPFDDIGNDHAFGQRAAVVPWAPHPEFAGKAADRSVSLMKNRWVRVRRGDRVCYGQIEDAGPGVYDDARYVFGTTDERPANTRYNRAGMDVSPALNGCLGFAELNGERDLVDWQFVDDSDVPAGPWKKIVTVRGVSQRPRCFGYFSRIWLFCPRRRNIRGCLAIAFMGSGLGSADSTWGPGSQGSERTAHGIRAGTAQAQWAPQH